LSGISLTSPYACCVKKWWTVPVSLELLKLIAVSYTYPSIYQPIFLPACVCV
jgi:hypothetical protein